MVSWLKRFAAPIAVIAFLGMPAASKAETVTFSTTGSFSAAGSDTIGTASFGTTTYADSLLAGGGQNLDLAFTGATNAPTGQTTPVVVTLGTLSLIGGGQNQSFANGDQFTLHIDQSTPGIGGGDSTADITGNISFTSVAFTNGVDSGVLTLHFNTNPVLVTSTGTSISYQLADVNYTVANLNQPFKADITLSGYAAAVPLPSTAWMGLGLLGCVGSAGAFKSIRRRGDVLSA
jgi:hypothetical protein